jgi:hypothetical protein
MSSVRTIIVCLSIVVLLTKVAGAQKIASISPASASPGEEVVLTGGPFPDDIRVVIGEQLLSPQTLQKNRLHFLVPDLPEGIYLLGLQEGERRIETDLVLTITSPAPRITDISPRQVDNCDKTRHTLITVFGEHFASGSRVLLDGAAVASHQQNGQLVFALPATVKGGQHEIVVSNPNKKNSLPEALEVQTQPEIYSVSQGADQVNSYEVIITGRNFLYSSTLVVDGRQINNLPRLVAAPPQSDHVRFVDCEKLIYVRYPYSREVHDVNLQIVNPDGQESPVMAVAIP